MKGEGSDKPAGQMHMKRKPKATNHRRTMGTGKVKPKAKGTMGNNQKTGDGGASNF